MDMKTVFSGHTLQNMSKSGHTGCKVMIGKSHVTPLNMSQVN